MQKHVREHGAIVLSFTLFIFMLWFSTKNTGSPGGADPFTHFVMARWSFTHPTLFFDQWGKPLYTIFVAPFTLIGFKWAVAFNIILSVASGFLVYKSALKLKIKNAWLGIVFTVFTPIFFYISFSTLTEIMFAFVGTLSVYLFISKKYYASVIVMSFIPFARTEGIIFFPILIAALVLVKKYKFIPLLLVGFVVMAFAGYTVMNDILWPINTIPYAADSSGIYGQGELSHFLMYLPYLLGFTLIILFVIGVLNGFNIASGNLWSHNAATVFLLTGISIGYFSAHSVVWAFGMGGSAGLIRVIAGVTPTVALVALWGFDSLMSPISSKPRITFGIAVLLGLFVIQQAFSKNNYPINDGVEMQVVRKATHYLKQTELDTNFIIYYNPIVAYLLDIDPYSRVRGKERFDDPNNFDVNTPKGTIFIWESHFSPFGNQVSKDKIESNPDFIRIKDFQPDIPFKVSGGRDYEVIIYQKTE